MSTSGGSRLTEVKALTVVPQGWMPSGVGEAVVMTVTPVTKRPRTSRYVSGSISRLGYRPIRRVARSRMAEESSRQMHHVVP